MIPTRMDFLVSYWVANPITYNLKQVISDGLVNSLQRSSVGYQGIEPRYLKMLIFTGNKHLFVAYHYVVLLSMQLFIQHSYYHSPYQKTIPTILQVGYIKSLIPQNPAHFQPTILYTSQIFNILCNQNSILVPNVHAATILLYSEYP